MRMLSVDFDFFFPEDQDWDWSHGESFKYKFLDDMIWETRAAQFIAKGLALPSTSGDEVNFWKRFKFNDAHLYYADSHVKIITTELLMGINQIYNFDAHHDAFTFPSLEISAENWAVDLVPWIKVVHVAPSWSEKNSYCKPVVHIKRYVDEGKPFKRVFDSIFVCRSGGWTPTWLEDKFWKFIEDCPTSFKSNMDNMTKREFSMENAAKDAAKIIEVIGGKHEV